MERLFNFVYQYRAFFTFLALEVFCAWLIVENNQYQGAKYFNSSNRVAAAINGFAYGVREYFSLRQINSDLAFENAELRTKLEEDQRKLNALSPAPPKVSSRFTFTSAKVVNNSVDMFRNFITIDKGKDDGIAAGMAVISGHGAVGKIKSVSAHYAVMISLLNIDEHVSSVIKSSGYFGTAQGDGVDPRIIQLRYIPRHVVLHVGDSVVTSGFNAVFPEGIPVGVIKEFNLREEALFYDIKVELAQDFRKLAFVEVVKSTLKPEVDALERSTIPESK